ncbi:probable cGMP 3',5'-cyclic phosphodiesterase subunit delta [Leptopilina heterotoma]|uniref:probable cGMP 3',5'-cyclic phosphodiesterase subunit delta n=1 Tax=Leptopilina heterotoma TaxID=63436 RepID=UPI001CA8ADBA|nr:probable cGMP 3',5'-cyclic phosphodiesterase subunit delta [Leptopilina heterotoma]
MFSPCLRESLHFEVLWMRILDVETKEVLWESKGNMTFTENEQRVEIPETCGGIIREIKFSSFKTIPWFCMEQKLLFKGKDLNKWSYESSHSGEKTVTAMEIVRIPVDILSGEITMVTTFTVKEYIISLNRLRFFKK